MQKLKPRKMPKEKGKYNKLPPLRDSHSQQAINTNPTVSPTYANGNSTEVDEETIDVIDALNAN
jgi:hypothetical protein